MSLNFDDYKCTLQQASYDSDNKKSLIERSELVINYDDFQQAYFDLFRKSVCCSIDALTKVDNEWFFIEFKNCKIDSKIKKNISEKIGHSIITFLDNLNKNVNFNRENVNFILVYSKEKNSNHNSGNTRCANEYPISVERNKLYGALPGVKRDIPLFKMGRYEKIYFKKVYTYSKEEFEKFVEEKF